MSAYIVLSAIGRDRPGFIHQLTHTIHQLGGNVELQRSVRAASEYAVILLFTLEKEEVGKAVDTLNLLRNDELYVNARPALSPVEERPGKAKEATIHASGADQSGIIDAVTLQLFEHGVNVESMNFGVESAPWTGEPLFKMDAKIAVPPETDIEALRNALRDLEDEYNFDVLFEPE